MRHEVPVGPTEQAAESTAPDLAARRRAAWLVVVVLVLVAVATQAPAAGRRLQWAWTTSALQRRILSTTDVPDGAALPDVAGASGVQARALALLAEEAGQPAEAERVLSAALAAAPGDELTRFELCRFYARRDRWIDAQRTCAGSAASVEYWLQQGVKAADAHDAERAIAWFQLATVTDPGHSEAWHQLGRARLQAKRFAEAIPAFERVLALDDRQPFDVINALGTAYLQVNNPARARATAERGLLIYPNRRELYVVVGESLRLEDDLDAADRWFSQWLQQWPGDAFAWSQRGEIAMQGERFSEAISHFQQATIAAPETAGYWMNLGMAAANAGNTTLATDAYDKALSLRPDDAAMWLTAGRSLRRIDAERARAAFERVLLLQPGNSEAAAELAGLVDDADAP